MKFLVDNQLPAALVRWLVSRRVECEHVLELGLAEATDAEIWDYASQKGYVVISKDEDFLYFANEPASQACFVLDSTRQLPYQGTAGNDRRPLARDRRAAPRR